MRTTPRLNVLQLRVALLVVVALLLVTGLRGTPAGAECAPGSGRAGPVPPPPTEEPEDPPPPPPPPTTEPEPPPSPPPPVDPPAEDDAGDPPPPEGPTKGKPEVTPGGRGRGEPDPGAPPPPEGPTKGKPEVTPGDRGRGKGRGEPDPGAPPPPEPDTGPVTTPSGDDQPSDAPPASGAPQPAPSSGNAPTPTPRTPTGDAAGGGRPDPTVGGTRRPRPKGSAANAIEWRWSTWWTFNRWNYLPSRNEVVKRNFARFRVVTGTGPQGTDAWTQRRDALARMRAAPALVRIMRADLRPGDVGIKAAASIGLARVSNSREAVASILAALENPRMTHEVREAAAFATGLLRRTEPAQQMAGERVDALRARLFALADDPKTPRTVQCLAIMSVGMLGDQPRATPLPPGVMETRALWRRLVKEDRGSEVHIAYLTALGMQPESAAAEAVLEGLRDIALGKRFAKRSWSSRERSHALCTLVRLGGPRWSSALGRLMSDRRITTDVRRAAFITLGERAAAYGSGERKDLVRTWEMALKLTRDPLTRGLGLIALGRIVGADQADGGKLLRTTDAGDILLKHARSSAQNMRGFAVLALALALRGTQDEDRMAIRFRRDGENALKKGLAKRAGNAEARGPYVVAAGLARIAEVLPTLEAIIEDSNAEPQLRAYASVACGQIGRSTPTTVHALKRAVADYKLGNLRVEAALGLAYLTGDRDAKLLREDIERRRYTHSHRIGHVAIALGQMGDLRAVVPLSKLLLDEASDHGARGAAAVALGLLCDPEKKPSQSRLWQDVNYPARSAAMHAALNFY